MEEGTRERLVRIATEMISREGLAALTLRALGANAGVSRGTPYRHFATKTDLLIAVASARMSAIMQAVRAGADVVTRPADRLSAALTAYVDGALAEPELYSLIFMQGLDDDESELRTGGRAAFAYLQSLVRPLVGVSAVADAAASTWAATHGAIMLTLAGHAEGEKGLQDTVHVAVTAARLITRSDPADAPMATADGAGTPGPARSTDDSTTMKEGIDDSAQ